MQHSRIGRCAVSTRDLRNNTHDRLVCVLFQRWHFCSVHGNPADTSCHNCMPPLSACMHVSGKENYQHNLR